MAWPSTDATSACASDDGACGCQGRAGCFAVAPERCFFNIWVPRSVSWARTEALLRLRAPSKDTADRQSLAVYPIRRRALPRSRIGLRRFLAGDFLRQAPDDSFGHRLGGRQHGEIDLQQGLERVMALAQGGEHLGQRLAKIRHADLDARGVGEVTPRQIRFFRLQRARLAQVSS